MHAGWINVDCREPADLIFDLDHLTGSERKLPLLDNSVEEINASHVLEHLHDLLGLASELWRVAKDGCVWTIHVPYGASEDFCTDVTHVRQFGLYTFRSFAQPWYHNNDYGYYADWHCAKVTICCLSEFETMNRRELLKKVLRERNIAYQLRTQLVARKPARPPHVGLAVNPEFDFLFAGNWL
jgi:ubiquinone/menaquinone biosynthesis C-methylase UbiE